MTSSSHGSPLAETATNRVPARIPRIALIGLNGFGRQHLLNIHRLAALGKAELVAGVSSNDPGAEIRGKGTEIFPSFDELIDAGVRPDVVIVSSPINTHFELAMKAIRLGADVFLEKPPTATLTQYDELLAFAQASGARVQVGFQAVGSTALRAIESFFADDAQESPIGTLRAVGASGTWVRDRGYYNRAAWAGHRVLNGVATADGVITNPLAHAVMDALFIAGARQREDVAELSVEMYHAHDIEADDTSVVRLRTQQGIPVTAALTLCANEQTDPWITIYGTEGQATLYYTRDELLVQPNTDLGGAAYTRHFERVDLLENLLDVRSGTATTLLCPLESTGAFMHVLEQVCRAEDPAAISPELVHHLGRDDSARPAIPEIENFIARAVAAQSGYASLGAPWAARPATNGQLEVLAPDTGERLRIATVRTGTDISPTNSPRPFLDELRTLSGIALSDQQPLDHTWHLGVGVALQDVNGTNFWGGRTYTRDAGRYIWRGDHGHIRTESQNISADGSQFEAELAWIDHHGDPLLREQRKVTAGAFADNLSGRNGWVLDFEYSLFSTGGTVSLGSPGSNGRPQGGYGGFFWRLPRVRNGVIFTDRAQGEDAVHGTVSDWLAFSAEFTAESVGLNRVSTGHGRASLIFCAPHEDPWFVRYAGYPGIGSSLAWDTPVIAVPGNPVTRRTQVIVLDGDVDPAIAADLVRRQIHT